MRLPRVQTTVRGIVLAVAIICVDLAIIGRALRADESEPCTSSLVFPSLIFVPPLSLLALAAFSITLGVARSGRASSFATGYLLLGGMATLGVCLDFAMGSGLLFHLVRLAEGVFDPSLAPGVPEALLTSPRQPVLDDGSRELMLLAICSLPQFAFAMLGGALASRFGLEISRRHQEPPIASELTAP